MMNKDALKKLLRHEIKQEKKLLSNEKCQRCANEVFHKLVQMLEFVQAQHVLCYWSLPDELYTHQFINVWYKQKSFYLPRVVNSNLEIVPYAGMESMATGQYNILEPKGEAINNLEVIDLVIVPGLAFTKDGVRLGRGGGYYDRFLPQVSNAIKMGVGYNFQIKQQIPFEDHDIKMDIVIYECAMD